MKHNRLSIETCGLLKLQHPRDRYRNTKKHIVATTPNKLLQQQWNNYCNIKLKQLKHTAPSQKSVLLQYWDEEVETPRNVLLQQQKEQQLKH
jgi:hypothetical protein